MKRREALRIISEHEKEIKAFGVDRLSLFGSVARDEAGPDSDVDVLVEFDPGTRVGMFRFLDLKEFLEQVLDRRVDLVTKDSLRRQLRDRILEEAVGGA